VEKQYKLANGSRGVSRDFQRMILVYFKTRDAQCFAGVK